MSYTFSFFSLYPRKIRQVLRSQKVCKAPNTDGVSPIPLKICLRIGCFLRRLFCPSEFLPFQSLGNAVIFPIPKRCDASDHNIYHRLSQNLRPTVFISEARMTTERQQEWISISPFNHWPRGSSPTFLFITQGVIYSIWDKPNSWMKL